MELFALGKNIHGEKFHKLLKLCFEICEYFTLTDRMKLFPDDCFIKHYDGDEEEYIRFLAKLSFSIVRKESKYTRWFIQQFQDTDIGAMEIYFYKTTSEAFEVLIQQFENLFFYEKTEKEEFDRRENSLNELPEEIRLILESREKEEFDRVTDMPQDICFFKDKRLFLGTLSHEQMCYLYSEDDAVLKQILALGDWEKLEEQECGRLMEEIKSVELKF